MHHADSLNSLTEKQSFVRPDLRNGTPTWKLVHFDITEAGAMMQLVESVSKWQERFLLQSEMST